jgi:hypothetical protein
MERHEIAQFPEEFSDVTQLYHIMDSSDIAIQETMELHDPYVQGECIPMKEFNLQETDTILFGTKGYWRDAWKLERHLLPSSHSEAEKVVLKTLKYKHRCEDKYFEHNRIDAVAIERLTSSKHVMDVYSFCGNSVFMEYAGGPRLGTIADKARGAATIRLARDIAEGIADVHSIDGEESAIFTHFDINFSNIGVVNGSIKLNDYNIAVLRKWNTSNEPCGFPSPYPNPQWQSPLTAMTILISIFIIIFQFIKWSTTLDSADNLHLQPDTSDEITIHGAMADIDVNEIVLPVNLDCVSISSSYSFLFGVDEEDVVDVDDVASSCFSMDSSYLYYLDDDDDSLCYSLTYDDDDDIIVDDLATVFSIATSAAPDFAVIKQSTTRFFINDCDDMSSVSSPFLSFTAVLPADNEVVTSQPRRSPRIASMKPVSYKKFF